MVTVYTTPKCGYCRMAKVYLSSRKVHFSERDISKDPFAAHWVENTVGQLATPVMDIEGEVILGFDRNYIDLALRRKSII